jgi:hypothetical protein
MVVQLPMHCGGAGHQKDGNWPSQGTSNGTGAKMESCTGGKEEESPLKMCQMGIRTGK